MAIRPLSTVGTGGVGNPVLSLAEDAASAVLSLFAIVLPVLALLLVIAFFVAGWRLLVRLRAAARGRPEARASSA
jgi:hypothetical protein